MLMVRYALFMQNNAGGFIMLYLSLCFTFLSEQVEPVPYRLLEPQEPLAQGPDFQRAPKTSRSYLLLQYSCQFSHASSYSFTIFFENCLIFCTLRNLFLIFMIFPNLSQYAFPNYSFLKLLKCLAYFRGLQTFLGTGPPKSWIRHWLEG